MEFCLYLASIHLNMICINMYQKSLNGKKQMLPELYWKEIKTDIFQTTLDTLFVDQSLWTMSQQKTEVLLLYILKRFERFP